KTPVVRSLMGFVMMTSFSLIIYNGPIAIALLVLLIIQGGFFEISRVGYSAYNAKHLPYFKKISYLFLFSINYFMCGETIIEKFGSALMENYLIRPFVLYHKLISFFLYTIGFVLFVLTLKKPYFLKQFTLFAYVHVSLIVAVAPNLAIRNLLFGLVWFIVPACCVIFNDIAAYTFGFFYGRTKLIKLSPKKTWEGFIGAFFTTIIFALVLSSILCCFKFFTCPLEYDFKNGKILYECENSQIFQGETFYLFGLKWTFYPFHKHALVISMFASLVAPFGGFFSSGFKRAFNIKDFGNTIPGHGGIIDRFDCQILIFVFVYVYTNSIISTKTPNFYLNEILSLNAHEQTQFLKLIKSHFNNLDGL
ncbi:unnamed protein product, partial [Brachionus calyciflorus]